MCRASILSALPKKGIDVALPELVFTEEEEVDKTAYGVRRDEGSPHRHIVGRGFPGKDEEHGVIEARFAGVAGNALLLLEPGL